MWWCFLETHAISITGDCGFVEWTMGLKIMGKEFIYPGTTRLLFGENGLIREHRDYFDFCGPTFGPVPILGPFIRWLYSKFVSWVCFFRNKVLYISRINKFWEVTSLKSNWE